MRPTFALVSLLALSACDSEPTPTDSAGEADEGCEVSTDVETILVENTAALLQAAAFIGQATDNVIPEAIYAADLYGEAVSAGWISFMGCDGGAATFSPTCVQPDEVGAWWSCLQVSCIDTQTLQVDAWFSGAQDSEAPFTIPLESTGGTLSVDGPALYSWKVAASVEATTVTGLHTVRASHEGADGTVDVSFTAEGTVTRGVTHPAAALAVSYPFLEADHTWSTTIDFTETGLEALLLRDGETVGTFADVTPEGSEHLVLELDWTSCGPDRTAEPELREQDCPPEARADCDPELQHL